MDMRLLYSPDGVETSDMHTVECPWCHGTGELTRREFAAGTSNYYFRCLYCGTKARWGDEDNSFFYDAVKKLNYIREVTRNEQEF